MNQQEPLEERDEDLFDLSWNQAEEAFHDSLWALEDEEIEKED
jgi:hypothetical protein